MALESIPSFPEFRAITIADKKVFDQYFKENAPASSEYTFTNFFCWKDCDHSKITKINDNLCVLAEDREGKAYFFEPLGRDRIEETVRTCADHLISKGLTARFSRLTSSFIEIFKERDSYLIEKDRGNFDYLYLSKDLAELKGKRYDGKRNRIKKFERENMFEYRKLTEKEIPLCSDLLHRWEEEKKGLCIAEPIKEALANYEELRLKGSVVMISGKAEAFTMGERLNDDIAVIYIEVASSKFAGLPQFINRKFSGEWTDFKYIDREQDLGDAGLRRAKMSYHPCRFIDKYNMTVTG